MYDEFGSAHHRNYYRRTLAHNSITVFDPDERFCNPIGDGNFDCTGPARLANDGGQRIQEIVPGFDYIPRNVDDLVHPQTPFDRGGVVIYEDTTEYTYALGRGGPSYQSAKVAVADRHFLWLKSVRDLRHPLVVVFDNVEGKDRDHVKAYHLHARNTVSVAGTTITATNENRITGEEGVLYDTVLLPRNPRITVRTGDAVFRVDGDVYAPEERADETTASILELERSRVEVCPPTQNLVDQFLNVLYVTDAGGENRPSSSLVNAQGMYGLAVKDWIVLFAPRELSREGTTYSASGPASHLLIGMKDDVEFDILVDGNLRVTTRSSSEGTLRFDLSSGGDVEVRRG
jgi:heparin/heparan-sulfate lyase